MRELLRRLAKAAVWLTVSLGVLVCSVLLIGFARWLTRYDDSVTLPNGMILKRELDFSSTERDDMFASDGRTRLASDIEFVCFNDRYVRVSAYDRSSSGLYDGLTQDKVPDQRSHEVYAASGLGGNRRACNGYFIGMVGPGLLYDGMRPPFLPPCAWHNLDNPTLSDPSWFERPCDESDPLGRDRSD
jgi:hypothetical protein